MWQDKINDTSVACCSIITHSLQTSSHLLLSMTSPHDTLLLSARNLYSGTMKVRSDSDTKGAFSRSCWRYYRPDEYQDASSSTQVRTMKPMHV